MFKNRHFLSLTGQLITGLFGFVSFGMIARMADKTLFGNWILFITAYTFFEMLRNGMIQTSLVKFLSGAGADDSVKINGGGWFISIAITLIYGLAGLLLLGMHVKDGGWELFIRYGALALLSSLPYNYSLWLLQVDFQFNRILILRLINQSVYVVLLGILLSRHVHSLNLILCSFIAANLIPGMYSLISGWCRVGDILHTNRTSILSLFHFGKYSMGTSIGANLLRSSDTFLIQAFMGPVFVALYTAPQKMMEVIEIPLRSFAATAIPLMAGYVNRKEAPKVAETFEKYTGGISLILLPVIAGTFVLADLIMRILGGPQYAGTGSTLRIFMVYSLLMPLDRFLGISLDMVNKPALNFLKVGIMLIVNILGDLAAIYWFHSINFVALSSLLTFMAGITLGSLFLKRYVSFSFRGIFQRGLELVFIYYRKLALNKAG